jgi:hypothetical protein
MSKPLPSEIRRELLRDHLQIRKLLANLVHLAERIVSGEGDPARLRGMADQLRQLLREHNDAEEQHLEAYLVGLDAWGPIRVEQMLKEHAAEHVEMREALQGREGRALALAVPALAGQLRRHMLEEEQTFLHVDVLRDSLVTVGPTS